jgi:hypothetical protein
MRRRLIGFVERVVLGFFMGLAAMIIERALRSRMRRVKTSTSPAEPLEPLDPVGES